MFIRGWQSVLERPHDAPPLLMAHRGSSEELPENTLAAFRRALAQGAHILETDIRFTRDNEIVLMHDATIDRTTNGSGAVAEMTLAEIKMVRAQRSFEIAEALGDEEIPSLAEFLVSTGGERGVDYSAASGNATAGVSYGRGSGVAIALELKDDRFIETRDAERLIEVLSRHEALERTVLLSFSGDRVRACKRVAPQIPTGIITLKNPLPLYDTELMGPFFPLLYLNPLYFAWARRRGKIACPLDPAPEPRLGWYRRLGAPVLLTNHPMLTAEKLLEVFPKSGVGTRR